MSKTLEEYLHIYRQLCNFKPSEWIDKKTNALNEYMKKCNLKGCVIGLSGGVDSAVTLGLAILAMKQENSPIEIIVPILMPTDIYKPTYKRAVELCKHYGLEPLTDTIGYQSTMMRESHGTKFASWYHKQTGKDTDWKPSQFAYGQLQSYLRTPHLYFTTQLLNDRKQPSIVLGTGNADEDHYLGYFCKAGDGVVDLQLINDLHKSQVFSVGKEIGVINSILNAPPTADLWDDQSDEDELGFTYDFVELYTGYYLKLTPDEQNTFIDSLKEEEKSKFIITSKLCNEVHQRNKHKLNGVVNL